MHVTLALNLINQFLHYKWNFFDAWNIKEQWREGKERGEVLAFTAEEMDGLRDPAAERLVEHLQQDSLPG